MGKNPQKELFNKVVAICTRAEDLGISVGQRIDRIMDIENAVEAFNIDIDEWLAADDFNFAHDYSGIVANIRRNLGINHKYTSKDFKDCFVPRFSRLDAYTSKDVIKEAKATSPVSQDKANNHKNIER